jgi:excisionase family DNA binding protein
MSKKYLSIEEAAAQVGVSSAELNRMREKGMIRAFADRGTWKFKEEDVEKLTRMRQADSDPDVPLHPEQGALDDEGLADQPTIIRKSDDQGSDSDVRLIFDDAMNVSGTGTDTPADDSDSDVKLASPAPAAAAPEDDSDSDVKIAGGATPVPAGGSDSDVKLVTDELPTKPGTGSDSDVRLVSSDSSGEVKLAGSSASMPVVPAEGGSTIVAGPAGDSGIDEGSGISLSEGSGVKLASDSGISLERPNDSGISLSDESSLVLSDESGISLAGEKSSNIKGDSGISLASGDSGISLDKDSPSDKKKRKDVDSDDLTGTVPLMDIPLAQDEDLLDTQMEVPNLDDSQGSGDVFGESGEVDATNVITLDDDEESGYEVTADIPTRGAAALEDDEDAVTAEEDEPVDVSDELIGEDDELAEDVFGAEDEDFGEEVESGESLSELPVAPRGMVAVEHEWESWVFGTLVASTVAMLFLSFVMFDLVRNMFHTDVASHTPLSNFILSAFK